MGRDDFMILTPMMQQYFDIKEQYKDCILFFRLGDFYEMFFEDAILASRELEITLTGRDCGQAEKAPMCGVPHHSAENYVSRLITKGFKVAICEQVEDVSVAKGIVKRDVVRVVTPGTLVESSMLDEKKNNYLMAIYKDKFVGMAVVDISTGELFSSSILYGNVENKLWDEIVRFSPSEVLVNNKAFEDVDFMNIVEKRLNIYVTNLEDEYFDDKSARERIDKQFGQIDNMDRSENSLKNENFQTKAIGALLAYINRTSKVDLGHIREIKKYKVEGFMNLDISSRRNLEICETLREKSKKGTILWVLDRTMTSMGGRALRKWLEQPLVNVSDIQDRLNAIGEFKDKFMLRTEIREHLKKVYDIERLIGKIVLGNANCRDLISLKNSILQLPDIKFLMSDCETEANRRIENGLDLLIDIYELIEFSIEDEPPIVIKEGGIIKKGFNPEVDKLKEASTEGKNWVIEIENREKEKTGIKNLKVGFNKIFGYYLEVTKSYFHLIPAHFIRKQTLANCERFITEELKNVEETILGAQEKVIRLEYDIFLEVKDKICTQAGRIKNIAGALAELDVFTCLAEVADRENFAKPIVDNGNAISIIEGRHPVVEKMIGQDKFIPNDTYLDLEDNRISIITGPNMAGKSTFMRQTAIIVLMAQMGSFVPAKEAHIGIVDRIFTRVGASDDLAQGQSTFMVEMTEVANILENASKRSLIILDEMGRGTSTYDGLSLAWSVIEYIGRKDKIGARTLFATHYHELTELEEKMNCIKNYCIAIQEKGDDIVFLHKIIRGGADGSYGIQVAKLAGLPQSVILRAKEILTELEDADIARVEKKLKKARKPLEGQVDIFTLNKPQLESDLVIDSLNSLDLSLLTPMEALNMLHDFQQKLKRS